MRTRNFQVDMVQILEAVTSGTYALDMIKKVNVVVSTDGGRITPLDFGYSMRVGPKDYEQTRARLEEERRKHVYVWTDEKVFEKELDNVKSGAFSSALSHLINEKGYLKQARGEMEQEKEKGSFFELTPEGREALERMKKGEEERTFTRRLGEIESEEELKKLLEESAAPA